MAGEGQELSTPTQQETTSASGAPEVKPPDNTSSGSETERKGFLSKILGRFSRSKGSRAEQQPNQESEQEIRDRLARLQADRENIQAAMNFPDSTGSSKIADAQRLEQIDQQLGNLRQQLPAETAQITQEPAVTNPGETEKAA